MPELTPAELDQLEKRYADNVPVQTLVEAVRALTQERDAALADAEGLRFRGQTRTLEMRCDYANHGTYREAMIAATQRATRAEAARDAAQAHALNHAEQAKSDLLRATQAEAERDAAEEGRYLLLACPSCGHHRLCYEPRTHKLWCDQHGTHDPKTGEIRDDGAVLADESDEQHAKAKRAEQAEVERDAAQAVLREIAALCAEYLATPSADFAACVQRVQEIAESELIDEPGSSSRKVEHGDSGSNDA